jgi:dihydroorotase/N-acyl-D-amino-acid deacylase
VAPGFIDLHTHARRGIFERPAAENYIRQGVTTLFEGPDGSSPLPIAEFLAKLDAADAAVNVGTFVGHGSIRGAVFGRVNRAPAPEELEKMRQLARQAMFDGAFGLSTGLFYVPGSFATTEEVIELARVVGELGGIHTSHIRDEGDEMLESVRETIRIGEEGHLPTHVTHFKVVMGEANEGKSAQAIREIEEARARGVDVTMDQYPYNASSTSLQSVLPGWVLEGQRADVVRRLNDPALRARIEADTVQNLRRRRGGSLARVQIATFEPEPAWVGLTLEEIAVMRGIEPTLENGARLVMEMVSRYPARAIYHSISEPDLERILVHPLTAIASDGEVTQFGSASPHPRSYGTFTRVLGHYVRERKLLTLEDAVRKMTSLPAGRAGLSDRGLLRPGMAADVVIFDASRIGDRATYKKPHQQSEGVRHVIVNGEFVLRDGAMTGSRPGIVFRGPAHRPSKKPNAR